MPVTNKPTNIIYSPFIRYSGTSAYNNMIDNPREYSEEYIISASITEKFKLTPKKQSVIASVHNSFVGHFGLVRTLKRLQEIGEKWEFQRQHVRHFIDRCPCCQRMPINLCTSFYYIDVYSNKCLIINFVGPFSDGGYILVIVCTVTRWIVLYHTLDATDRKSTRLNSSHSIASRMPSSA